MIEEIEIHCNQNGRYGFTIPYLYKIEKDLNREKSIEEILRVFSNAANEYFISFCDDLDEYVIGLHKSEYAPSHMYEKFDNLYYDQDIIGKQASFDNLIELMVGKYQKLIDKETYSKNIETKIWE